MCQWNHTVCKINIIWLYSDTVWQFAISVGQDIEGHILFPEDNYEASDDQEGGPQPEDKVYINTFQAINIRFMGQFI